LGITVDDVTVATPAVNAGSISLNHTCASGATVILVGVQVTDASDTERAVSSVTYNGDPLVVAKKQDGGGSPANCEIWRRVSPDTGGSYEVLVTMGGTCTDITAYAISLFGTKTDGNVIDNSNGAVSSGNPSVTVQTQTDDTYLVDSMWSDNRDNGDLSPAHTVIHNTDVGSDTHGAQRVLGGSAGPHVMNWTDADLEAFVICAVAVMDATASPPAGNPWWAYQRSKMRRAC